MTLILRVNQGGHPLGWIPWQEAVLLYAKDQVIWTVGEQSMRFYGGTNRATGARSFMDVHPVVAARGQVHGKYYDATPPLTNRELFRRDGHRCMYCLVELPDRLLTRDHVRPLSKGGLNVWSNVVTACHSCNHKKADYTPQQASMHLHAVPFAPSFAEWLILRNRKILADQMAFLQARCPRQSRSTCARINLDVQIQVS